MLNRKIDIAKGYRFLMKTYNLFIMGMALIVLLNIFLVNVSALVCPPVDCTNEVKLCEGNLKICNDTQKNLSLEFEYYQNLSSYYKLLYESKEINVTNRELIIINQQINNLNVTINDIKKELSFLKLTLKISVPIVSITIVSLWGFTIYLRKKLKKRDGE